MLLLLARGTTHSVIHLLRPRFCSSPPIQTPNCTVDYLVASFGLSRDKAARVYKTLAHLKCPQKPDSVLRFFKHNGFAEADIQTLITLFPRILCSNPENTLNPNLRALREMGLSTAALTQIILSNPAALQIQSAVPRIKFWSDFLGGNEADLVKALKLNIGLVGHNVAPKMSLLQNRHGLSTHEIERIVLRIPRLITTSIPLIEDLLERAKELGFQPGSPMFVNGLLAVSGNSRETLQKKMELLKSFGWSEDDFSSALRKYPPMAKNSRNNLETKMDFLMGEVRCDAPYIASNPELLTCSLEKRLRPRHHVLHLLESRGLSSKEQGFYSAIRMTDNKFVKRYILPHKDTISGLHETCFRVFKQTLLISSRYEGT